MPPPAASPSSSPSSHCKRVWRFVTFGPRRAHRQSHAAIELLEKFRQGPATQSEWNLLLWRATFPLVSLVLLTLLCVAGQFGHLVYSLVVNPVWYFCNLTLVACPFVVVFRFAALEKEEEEEGGGGGEQPTIWRYLAVISVGISLVEWYISVPASRYSWIVGNTLFGIVALGAVPLFFSMHRRTARSQYEDLVLEQEEQDQRQVHSAAQEMDEEAEEDKDAKTAGAMQQTQAGPLLPPASLAVNVNADNNPKIMMIRTMMKASLVRQRSGGFQSESETFRQSGGGLSENEVFRQSGRRSLSENESLRQWKKSHGGNKTVRQPKHDQMQREGQPLTRLLYGCGFCALVLWLVMFSLYSSARGGDASTRFWFLLDLLSPILCIVLFSSRVVRVRFSFEHAVAYSTLVVHVPLFLGHLCVRLFALAEDPSASSATSIESWLKLAISVLYLFLMQGYFFVITNMVNSMSEPFAHPSLLYVGQLYYYVFWYILVGSDTPIDALYWGMLFLNNVHIAFLNTGVYTDFKRTSSVWLTAPFHVNITSPLVSCLRSTSSAFDVSRCLPHRTSVQKQELLGLNCGVAGAAAMEASDDLLEDGDHFCNHGTSNSSNSVVAARNIDENGTCVGELPSWQKQDSRNRERDRSINDTHRGIQALAWDSALPTRKTGICKVSTVRGKCSQRHITCKKCAGRTSGSSQFGNEDVAAAALGAGSRVKTSTSEALRPLYFLMKLAEQDNMADTTALILVPSLLTLLAVFEKPGSALSVLQDQTNLWLRCVCMFIGRLGGAFLAREIFTCKLRSRLRSTSEDSCETARPDGINGFVDGMPVRLWIQRLMLQDFHAQFWYLTAVTIVVTFGCFARVDLPLRFALL
ncbi:unnamed protein product [Hyaloperonospora brassicae]|uniref:Transmembrane protein n=1 Tax=Hyaloperonospora brassicae TaxID=162125 RepID=A0AAV0TTC1_HYABA|nr:unnamed protein product [Hyaloperonospora brassicae]